MNFIKTWDGSAKVIPDNPLLSSIFSSILAANAGELPPEGTIVFPGMALGLPEKFTSRDVCPSAFTDEIFATKMRSIFKRLKIRNKKFKDLLYGDNTTTSEYCFRRIGSLPIALPEEVNTPSHTLFPSLEMTIYRDANNCLRELGDLVGVGGQYCSSESLEFEGTPPTKDEWNDAVKKIDEVRMDFRRKIIFGAWRKFPKEDRDVTEQDRRDFVAAVNDFLKG